MPRPRRWTDQQLVEAVAASATFSEVCRRIGIRPGRYDLLRKHITRIGVDASHLARLTPGPARRRWTDDELRAAVADAVTISEVQRALGYRPSGGTHGLITRHIRRLGLDTSHFLGRASTRGRTIRKQQNGPQPSRDRQKNRPPSRDQNVPPSVVITVTTTGQPPPAAVTILIHLARCEHTSGTHRSPTQRDQDS